MSRFRLLRPIDEEAPQAARPDAPEPAANGNGRGAAEGSPPPIDPELKAQRDRLLQRFTVLQLDLGGAFYEMAIRDHVRLDVLTRKAAELQRVDAELAQAERMIELARTGVAGNCPSCDAPYGRGVGFCSQCGSALVRTEGAG